VVGVIPMQPIPGSVSHFGMHGQKSSSTPTQQKVGLMMSLTLSTNPDQIMTGNSIPVQQHGKK
jgi:hypothetical protein